MHARLRTMRRHMLCRMFKIYKKKREAWSEYGERRAEVLNNMFLEHGMEDWPMTAMVLLHRWAGHLARMTDDRWSWLLTQQNCDFARVFRRQATDGHKVGRQGRGKPKSRWVDLLETYQGEIPWYTTALDRDLWKSQERGFAANAWLKLRTWPSLRRECHMQECKVASGQRLRYWEPDLVGGDERLRTTEQTHNGETLASESPSTDRVRVNQSFTLSTPLDIEPRSIPWHSPDLDCLPLSQLPIASEWPPPMFRDARLSPS